MKITVVEPRGEIITPESHMRDYAEIIEKAIRTCYKSEEYIKEDSAEKIIRKIMSTQHASTIEHCSITTRWVGSRTMSHQLVRHRIAAYSQESQRYCDYSPDRKHGRETGLQIIVPPEVGEVPKGTYDVFLDEGAIKSGRLLLHPAQHPAFRFIHHCASCYREYEWLRSKGVKAEDAREVLPNATKTEVVATFNLRMWRHVFKERALNPRAQWQIRKIANFFLSSFVEIIPVFFDDLPGKEFIH